MHTPAIITSSHQVLSLLSLQRVLPCNQVVLLFLNQTNQLVHKSVHQAPLFSTISLSAKDIFSPAITHHAKFVVIIQFRPSGHVAPQEMDRALADSVDHVGKYVGVRLLDYLLVSARDYYSFRESMLLASLKQVGELAHA